jgi:predicted amidophosphoribosyltransferase
MRTSGSTLPQRLTKIDDLTRPDHSYLTPDDDCYFIGEYTARRGFAFSSTNNLILNFKKSMDRRNRPAEWPYKGRAIEQAAAMFRSSLNERARETLTFVPVPPSKAKGDALYDDRLEQMLHKIWPGQATDVRELVTPAISTPAVHDSVTRPTPAELEARYAIDQRVREPLPQVIAVMDDVLTTGAHFVAVRNKLRREFPDTKIVGLFIARRVPEAVDIEDFDSEM